jgi:hypothetical protein
MRKLFLSECYSTGTTYPFDGNPNQRPSILSNIKRFSTLHKYYWSLLSLKWKPPGTASLPQLGYLVPTLVQRPLHESNRFCMQPRERNCRRIIFFGWK